MEILKETDGDDACSYDKGGTGDQARVLKLPEQIVSPSHVERFGLPGEMLELVS